jgi:hypothetical protein
MKTRNTRRGVAGKHQSTSELSVIDATALSTENQIEVLPPVDREQLDNLLEREGRIERAQRNAYLEIGLELKAIRDGKLYALRAKGCRRRPLLVYDVRGVRRGAVGYGITAASSL